MGGIVHGRRQEVALRSPQITFQPDAAMPARGTLLVYRPEVSLAPDGAAGATPGLGTGAPLGADPVADAAAFGFAGAQLVRTRVAVPAGDGVVVTEVPAAAVALRDALGVLLAGPERVVPAWRRVPDSLLVWSRAAQLGVAAVRRRLLAPVLRRVDGGIVGSWRALLDSDPGGRAAADRLAAAMPPAAFAIAAGDGVPAPDALLAGFLDAIADLCARLPSPPSRPGPPRARLLPWSARWMEALSDPSDAEVPLGSEGDELLAGVAGWHGRGGVADLELLLDAPEREDGPWRLAFGLRDEDGRALPAAQVWSGDVGGPERNPVTLQEVLLAGLGRCARVFPPLEAALGDPAPEAIDLDIHDAWRFVHEAAPVLSASDVLVRLPEELAAESLRLRLRLDVGQEGPGEPGSGDEGEDRAARLDWELALEGEALEPAQARRLVASDAPLVRTGDRWVRIDPELRAQVEALSGVKVPVADALLHALAGSVPLSTLTGSGDIGGPALEVVASGHVAALLRRLDRSGERPEPPPTPEGFTGELRGYQRRGVAWLAGMSDLGFGAVLADAMGLGKTVQLIAHLLGRAGDGPHLVVCPTSVVGNWERELARFAPGLAVTRFHGPDRPDELRDLHGVVVTSYGLMRRGAGPLADVEWDVVALDEAQQVKNPGTAGARAVRELRARQRVALTGTPLENRLAELWAVLDVTNPGLLGSRARFGKRFVAPVEQRRDAGAAARLRRIVAPFVLRREKREVLDDLPDKIEREVACTLTSEQAGLYAAAVERALGDGALEEASAMQRRGRVLALLTALKQICNHPAQYLRQGPEATLLGRSGKLATARTIVAEAVEGGDQVLLFTQFVEMGRLLVAQLSTDLQTDVPFLHGGVPAVGRDRMVAAFQGEAGAAPPVLVVSLRAGGTGLNLTAATQVVHFDRWWNPAVEDQATDRAHRIGQTRAVEVHKLLAAGTVEERIAAMLEGKRALAEAVVGSGEQWITELDDADLRELVRLSAPGEELDEDDDLFEGGDWAFEEAS